MELQERPDEFVSTQSVDQYFLPAEGRKPRWWMLGHHLEALHHVIVESVTNHSNVTRWIGYIVLAVLFNAYLISAAYYTAANDIPLDWCDGTGLLIVITAVAYLGLAYFQIVKPFFGAAIHRNVGEPLSQRVNRLWTYR